MPISVVNVSELVGELLLRSAGARASTARKLERLAPRLSKAAA